MEQIEALLQRASDYADSVGRPVVTLSYAQSLDGCIAAKRGQPLALSVTERGDQAVLVSRSSCVSPVGWSSDKVGW